jgi:hypothetical protein
MSFLTERAGGLSCSIHAPKYMAFKGTEWFMWFWRFFVFCKLLKQKPYQLLQIPPAAPEISPTNQ